MISSSIRIGDVNHTEAEEMRFCCEGKSKKKRNNVVALCTKRQKTSAANEECLSSNDDRLGGS